MNSLNRARLAALAGAMALVTAGCGGGGDGVDPTPAPAPAPAPSPAPAPAPTPAPAPAPAPTPAPTALELATKFLASYDQSLATSVPASSAERTAVLDNCYLHDGASRNFVATNYDATGTAAAGSNYSQSALTRSIGSRRSNVQVLADRATTNADGSTRREIDVQYDVTFPDGTVSPGGKQTLITGSSSGSCDAAENKVETRFLGNRKLVELNLIARNSETVSYALSDGSLRSPSTSVRRDIRFQVRDPGNVATYAVITGPGPAGNNGKPFGFKLLAPRLVRDTPELAGKPGTSTLADSDGFVVCSAPNSNTQVPEPTIADCVGSGVQGDNWGRTLSLPTDAAAIANVDAGFAAQGWTAGGVYTVAVYADDGWKTINGQSGKTPIATYTEVLEALPYTFAQMQTPPAQYPTITNSSMTLAQIAAAAKTTGGTTQLTWQKAQPPAGGKPQSLVSSWVYADGVKTGSTTGFPRIRDFAYFYPELTATTSSVSFTGKNPATDAKRAQTFELYYSDRQGHVIQHTTQLY